MTDTPAPSPAPRFSFAQMLPTLIFDVAMPIVIFNLLSAYGVPTLWALVAGGLSPAVNNIRIWVKSRRLEPLGIIVMAFLTIGTATSLITGSVFFTLIRESFLTATFGLICLGSLFAERPLLFYIMRQFVAGDDPQRIAWWNGLWEVPQFRAAQRLVTAVWGLVYLIEALLRVGFALVLSPAEVVSISPVMAFVVLTALIAWTRRYFLALRERRLREQQAAAPRV
ncbi:MAG TPA: VC0807 family protein [Stellaceae bacterium]|nr:VC0807 family protein [Stellaceae bacterium]